MNLFVDFVTKHEITRCFHEAYTGLPVVHVTENQKALNCVVLKPAAHLRKELSARQFAQPFPHVCGEIVVRNSPREAVRIKSNMFDIFGLARQIPQCVRPS